jgi:intraflagellar transport protein 52
MLPKTATLSERLRGCLQEGDENPRDFTTLFDQSIYQLDPTSLPKVIKSVSGALWATVQSILYLVWKH